MIAKVELERLIVIVNGNWTIECAALAVIALAYLITMHRKLGFSWRNWLFDMVPGMRVAIAIFAMSTGNALVRGTVWAWAVIYGRGEFSPELLALLLIGATIGAGGFLLAIVEIGIPLFGSAPWVITVAAMAVYTAASLIFG